MVKGGIKNYQTFFHVPTKNEKKIIKTLLHYKMDINIWNERER